MPKNHAAPLVSVIIPAYNHEKFVQETILSIVNQTYDNIELLLIDDGSNDLTYDKICELEIRCKKRFTRFYFERQKNAGTVITLNTLIALSQGKYIFLTASDDIAAPHAIETELNFLEDNPQYALCVGGNDIIDENSRVVFFDTNNNLTFSSMDPQSCSFSDSLMRDLPALDFFSEDFGSYFNLVNYGNHIPNGYLIRKSIFEKTGLYIKNAPLEDYWIMLQISKNGKMKYLYDTLFYYRWHKNNFISSTNKWDMTYKTLLYELRDYPEINAIWKSDHQREIEPKEFGIKTKTLRDIFAARYMDGKYQ